MSKIYKAEGLGASHVSECLNLRPADDGRGLVAVGMPQVVAPAGDVPFYEFSAADGVHLLSWGRGCVWLDGSTAVAQLDTQPLTALYDGADTLYLMTATGPLLFSWPGLEPAGSGDYPACTLAACDGPVAPSVVVPPRQLAEDYRRATALSAADARGLAADLEDALYVLAGEARAQNCMTQPALARYKLLDAGGRVLFTSAPLLLGSSHNYQGVRLAVDSQGVAEGYTLRAPSWRLQLTVPQGMPGRVRSVQLCVSPQLHPVAWWKDARVALVHGSVSAASTVTVQPPVNPAAVVAGRYGAAEATVAALAARIDALERVVATVPATAGTIEVACCGDSEPREECEAVETALARGVEAAPAHEARLMAPHCFTARCAARVADTVMWGDVAALRYSGYPAGMLAAQLASGQPWTAFVAVDFADGGRTVWRGSGSSDAPVMFNALLSYPSPDAVRISIGVTAAGTSRYGSYELSPLASGLGAVYVHPSAAPFELPQAAYAVPQPLEAACRYSGMVVAADAAAPLVPLAMRDACGGRVLRLLPAAGSTAAWDFGRTRFLAFGHGGIRSVALASGRNSLAIGRIDGRRVERAGAVAPVAGSEVYVVAGGDLVRISGTRVVTVLRRCGYADIAWIAPYAELLASPGNEARAEVVCASCRALRRYHRSIVPGAMLAGEHGAYAATASGLMALHREVAATLDVAWRMRASPAPQLRARGLPLRSLRLVAAGSGLKLRLAVAAASSLRAEPVASAQEHLSGRLATPHELRLLMRQAVETHISIEGTAGPDFVLESIEI